MPTPILNNLIYYIKAEDLPITSEMSSNGYFIYSDGNEIRRVSASKLVGDILQATFEVITPSTNVPSVGLFRFRVLEPNTFSNVSPSITVSQNEIDNNWVYIVVEDGVARKELESKPDDSSKIKDWSSTESLSYPSVRVYNGIIYRVKEGQDVAGSDVPNNSSKWEVLIQDTNELRLSVLQSILDIGDLSQLDTDDASSLVNAINELKEDFDFIQNTNANLLDSNEKIKEKYINYQRLDNLEESIFDTDGYFESDKIKPLSIETQMLSVGARSQRLNVEGVIWTPNYQDDVSKLKLSSGRLVHFTIDPDEPRIWNLSELVKTGLNNTSTYYIYAKCSRTGNNGTFEVTTQQIRFDDVAGFYYFLIGLAYPPIDGVRLIDKTYGASFIQGREITTGRIKSLDGGTYFDLDKGEIGGTIKFGSVKAEDYIEGEIGNIEVGGRNYLLNSKKTITSAAYNREYITLSEPTIIGQLYFFTLKCDDLKGKHIDIFDNTTVSAGKIIGRLELIRDNIYGVKFIAEDSFSEIRVRKNDTSDVVITTYEAKLEKGNKATDWTPSPEDVESEINEAQQDAINASNAYADAQAELERIQAEAYADGIVDAEEARAIQDAKDKRDEAKLYAEQQDAILEGVLENYTDDEIGKIEIGGTNRVVLNNLDNAWFRDDNSREASSTYSTTSYTRIEGGANYITSGYSSLGVNPATNFYDENKNHISGISGNGRIKFKTPANAKFLRFSFLTVDKETIKIEKGNKATDWTPAPEDVEARIQQAKQDALDAQTTANAVKEVTDWMNPTIIGGGGVVASGTMLVGNNAQGARAGISGLGTAGNSVRQWAGADFAGRATAPFVVLQDGTWKQHSANGVLVRRTGVIGGNYVDELYNSNGQVAKRTAIVNGKIVEQWYNDGVLVYEIGENGIYYVTEIPESWTKTELMSAGTGTNPSPVYDMAQKLCNRNTYIEWRYSADVVSYRYDAGQNVYSESNKQYEGYKTTNLSKTSNIANGWYVIRSSMVPIMPNGDAILSAMRIIEGKVSATQEIIVPSSSIQPC